MKKAWKYIALGSALTSLVPYRVKREEDGTLVVRSLALEIRRKFADDGKQLVEVNILPVIKEKLSRKRDDGCTDDVAEGESVLIIDETAEETPVKEAPETAAEETAKDSTEADAEKAEEAAEETPTEEPAEETPVEETPAEETPAEEPTETAAE